MSKPSADILQPFNLSTIPMKYFKVTYLYWKLRLWNCWWKKSSHHHLGCISTGLHGISSINSNTLLFSTIQQWNNPGCLKYIGNYTTQLYRDSDNPVFHGKYGRFFCGSIGDGNASDLGTPNLRSRSMGRIWNVSAKSWRREWIWVDRVVDRRFWCVFVGDDAVVVVVWLWWGFSPLRTWHYIPSLKTNTSPRK